MTRHAKRPGYLCQCDECRRHKPPPKCRHTIEMFPRGATASRGASPAPTPQPEEAPLPRAQAELFTQEG